MDSAQIDKPPISQADPGADQPEIHFPVRLRTEDASLNQFIEHALTICRQGDYDEFRLLFGTQYEPTENRVFDNLWHGVGEVTVAGVYPGRKDREECFVHAMVLLREPDRQGRRQRELVVMVFKEGENWRIGPPPKEAQEAVLAAATQAATRPAARSAN